MAWKKQPTTLKLLPKEVHIWRMRLNQPAQELQNLVKYLSHDENERARNYLVKNAAENFILARSALRILISRYLERTPQDIVFEQTERGKLYLDSSPLCFNISHSRDLSLFIFALNTEVGIDVEYIRNDFDYTAIASRFFAQKEITELLALPKQIQKLAFFNCWSRKEAFIKALGEGMFAALDQFSVGISRKKSGKIALEYDAGKYGPGPWSLEALDPDTNYSGAFAIGASEYKASYYDFGYDLGRVINSTILAVSH